MKKKTKKPEYYKCGCCECYHPANWEGDCREDVNRFAMDELDTKHGAWGWDEVEMPVGFTKEQISGIVKFPDKSKKS